MATCINWSDSAPQMAHQGLGRCEWVHCLIWILPPAKAPAPPLFQCVDHSAYRAVSYIDRLSLRVLESLIGS